MGRDRKNESGEWGIIDQRPNYSGNRMMSLVEIPFYNEVIFKIKTGVDNDGNPTYGESRVYVNEFLETKEKTIKRIEKQSWLGVYYKVIRFEPIRLIMPNECPQCREIGFPNIDRISNGWDYHLYQNGGSSWINDVYKRKTNRSDSYSLTYSHRIGNKVIKHAISRLNQTFLSFLKKGQCDIKMIKYIFPYFLKPIKNI